VRTPIPRFAPRSFMPSGEVKKLAIVPLPYATRRSR
jgi:hypothetical protein